MNDFRHHNQPRKAKRQAIDGILNSPVNRSRGSFSGDLRPRRPNFADRVRNPQPRQRVIGDFRQPDGYHSTDRSGQGRIHADPQDATQKRKHPSEERAVSGHHIRQRFVADQPESGSKKRRRFLRKNRNEHRKQQRPTWRKWALRGGLSAFALLFIGIGIFGYLNFNKIFQGGGEAAALNTEVDVSKLRGEGDGRVNILLLGRGGAGHDGPDLTDTLLVASIDPVNKKAALVSIPRDLWVEGKYSESKINAVFAGAKNAALADGDNVDEAEKVGIRATEKVIENVLGINIHYYGMIDFKGFERAVNTVGGVTIDVPEELRDPTMAWENNWDPVLAKKGPQTMDGKQALMYVRSRYSSARGDFDRSERQRLLIMALKDKILSAGTFSNPVKVSKLMADFGDNAKTDFSLTDMMRLYSLAKDIKSIESIGLTDEPHDFLTTGSHAGQSVVMPKAGIFAYDEIRQYIRSALPDGYIISENAPITVLNGTTTVGIAQQKADELKSYKYNVRKVENAPTQDYNQTILVDLTGKDKYTLNYLERRLGVKATRDIPEGISVPDEERKGFIIIIGRNETTTR